MLMQKINPNSEGFSVLKCFLWFLSWLNTVFYFLCSINESSGLPANLFLKRFITHCRMTGDLFIILSICWILLHCARSAGHTVLKMIMEWNIQCTWLLGKDKGFRLSHIHLNEIYPLCVHPLEANNRQEEIKIIKSTCFSSNKFVICLWRKNVCSYFMEK